MEITLEAIISLIGLLTGGGGGAFFTWRWMKRKAAAEAAQAEAEAKAAQIDMAQKVQDTYQQMLEDKNKEVDDNHRLISELREDRDHYKQGYVEFRDQLDTLSKEFREFRNQTEDERSKMKRDIARNGRMLEALSPFTCGLAQKCPKCVPVTISATGELEKTIRPETKQGGIEPLEYNDL